MTDLDVKRKMWEEEVAHFLSSYRQAQIQGWKRDDPKCPFIKLQIEPSAIPPQKILANTAKDSQVIW